MIWASVVTKQLSFWSQDLPIFLPTIVEEFASTYYFNGMDWVDF